MTIDIQYSPRERFWFWMMALFGLIVINGIFLYTLFFKPDLLFAAITNPVSAAFMIETFLLLGAFAYLLSKWQVNRLSWRWFVVLSLLGSMAFALPVVILWPGKNG